MAQIVVALVAGLPAYVIVKILNPGFFAREDTRTPVWTALASLIFNIAVNLFVVQPLRHRRPCRRRPRLRPASTACCSMPSCTGAAGSTSPAKLAGRIAAPAAGHRRNGRSAVVGAAATWRRAIRATYAERVWSLGALVALGLVRVLWRRLPFRRARQETCSRSYGAGVPPSKADDDILEVQ